MVRYFSSLIKLDTGAEAERATNLNKAPTLRARLAGRLWGAIWKFKRLLGIKISAVTEQK